MSANLLMNEQVRSQYVQNILLERKLWLQKILDPRRDIDAECGHPVALEVADYVRFYKRGDVAARVVNVWPEESWSEHPSIYETEDPKDTAFELAWEELDAERALVPMMFRVDILSGIGHFGVMLLGLDDGLPLDQPAAGVGEDGGPLPEAGPEARAKLLYLRVLDESCVQIADWEQNTASPRYGMPVFYNIFFENTSSQQATNQTSVKVHWTRIIHVADNRMSSEIFGRPRMEKVVNRLLDLAKVAGGSGEMFWKGGFPGISLETLPEVMANASVEIDVESTKQQMEAYMNGLQRYIATIGMKANSLNVQVADPTPFQEAQLKLIAIALSIPWRVFVGSEAAQLASEQDIRTWNRRVARRRHDYVTPFIIRPVVRRLIACGVLPAAEKLIIDWPDLNTPSDKDKATVAEGLTSALTQYVTTGVDALVPAYHFLTLVLGMTKEEAMSVIEAAQSGTQEIDLSDVRKEQDEGRGDDVEDDIPSRNGTAASATK